MRRRGITPALVAAWLAGAGLAGADTAVAAVFKCVDARGATVYADRPCPGKSQTYDPKPLNEISSDRLTAGGGGKTKGDGTSGRQGWVSPLDPVANCHKRGGRFDREMRGCLLP